MNDDFVAFSLFLTIYMISFTFGLIMQLNPGRVPLNYVSNMSKELKYLPCLKMFFCSWYVLEHFTKNGMMNQKSSTFQTLSVVFVSYLEYTSPHEFCTPNIRPEKLYKLVWKLRIKKKPTLELILGLGWLLPWFGSEFSVLPNSIRKNFNHKKNERFNPNCFFFRIGPKDIKVFPNNLWVYFVHFIYPLSFGTFLCISFYAKEKPLRREFSEHFNPLRNRRFRC